jgi:hypothetical protein
MTFGVEISPAHTMIPSMVKLNSIQIIQEWSCWFNNKWYLGLMKPQPQALYIVLYMVGLKLKNIQIIQEWSCWFNNKWYIGLMKSQPNPWSGHLCSTWWGWGFDLLHVAAAVTLIQQSVQFVWFVSYTNWFFAFYYPVTFCERQASLIGERGLREKHCRHGRLGINLAA